MWHLIRSIAVFAGLFLSPPCLGQETYANPTLGFSIRKPSSWHYLSAEQHRENLKRSDFADPKFKELVARYSRTPFLAITKHKEPHDDVNWTAAMPDGAAPQTIKRKRDLGAKTRIAWAIREEIAAAVSLTLVGFQLMSRREQLRRIEKQLRREGVPESDWPTARQLSASWQGHASLDGSET